MNKNELFRAVGEISDDLIAEAENPIRKIKRLRTAKILLVAAAVTVLLSFSAFAARNILVVSRSGHSKSSPTYISVPSQKRLLKDVGIAPRIPNGFSNGYTYKNAHISKDTDYDADGNVVEKFKSLYCNYTLGEERFSLHIDAAMAGSGMKDETIAENYRDSEIQYFSYKSKVVPGNYTLTEQDEEDKKSGKYVFSFGSDDIEIYDVQITSFCFQGLNYTICALDSSLTKESMIQTAKEIIDYQM